MNDDAERGFVMPCLLSKSNGGLYDDHAIAVGIAMGEVHETLRRGDDYHRYAPPEIVANVDLLAAFYGYTLVSEPWDEFPDEWTLLTLTKQAGGR